MMRGLGAKKLRKDSPPPVFILPSILSSFPYSLIRSVRLTYYEVL